MKKNIVLVGILGCGKSSLGKKLAKRLSMEYVDMDAVIEEEAQMTITDMFARFGESYFRDKETELCRRLARRQGLVISTGGGVIQRPENMEALKETVTENRTALNVLLEWTEEVSENDSRFPKIGVTSFRKRTDVVLV